MFIPRKLISLYALLSHIQERFQSSMWGERERFILWFPVLLALGVGCYFSLGHEPDSATGFTLFAIILIFIWLSRKIFTAFWCLLILASIIVGFSLAQWHTLHLKAPVISKKTRPVKVQGVVLDIERLSKGQRLTLTDLKIEKIIPTKTPKKVRIKVPQKMQKSHVGDRIEVLAILNPPGKPVLPRGFDFRRHAYFLQLGATGYALSEVIVLEKNSQSYWWENIRQTVINHVNQHIPNAQTASIASALFTGEKRSIPKNTIETIRAAGIAHLLAISGLHIGLVTGFIFFIVRALLASNEYMANWYPLKKVAAIVAFGGGLVYLLLVGAPVSAQRALLMTGLVLLAILLDRQAISMRLAAFAATVVLFFSPQSLLGASFQMSFAAVVALIAFYEATADWWKQHYLRASWFKKMLFYLLASLCTTTIASLATAPIALFHFQKVSFISGLLANMVAVPLTAFWVMPLGLVALVLMPFGLEGGALQLVAYGIELILKNAHYVVDNSWSMLYSPMISTRVLVVCTIGGLWMTLWLGRKRWLGVLPLFFGVWFVFTQVYPDIYISEKAKLIAIRADDGVLYVNQKRTERFSRKIWEQGLALPEVRVWPKSGAHDKFPALSCDAQACLYIDKRSGLQISFVKDALALKRDCQTSDVLITAIYKVPSCDVKTLLTGRDLKYQGAHTVYLDPLKIVSVITQGNKRLWQ